MEARLRQADDIGLAATFEGQVTGKEKKTTLGLACAKLPVQSWLPAAGPGGACCARAAPWNRGPLPA